MQKFLLEIAHADDRVTNARRRERPPEFVGMAAD
jgi:hypothetical protein